MAKRKYFSGSVHTKGFPFLNNRFFCKK